VDYNNSNRLNIDDFIKLIKENKINLSINDIQLLFHSYELYNNGLFYYEEMFKDLKGIYFDNERLEYIEGVYQKLIQQVNRNLKISDLKLLFNPESQDNSLEEFYDMVDSFQFIMKLNRNDSQLSKEQFIDFFKFFGFGISDNEQFAEFIRSSFDISRIRIGQGDSNNLGRPQKKRQEESKQVDMFEHWDEKPISYENSNNYPTNQQEDPLLEKLRNNLKNYGRKSLFSLIKHFKYYENGTKFINKYDFAKVMRDFRLNLTITEIEKLFEENCTDKKRLLLNYEKFILHLCRELNDRRKFLIDSIYDGLEHASQNNKVDIDLVKSLYSPKNVPIQNKDSDEILNEFIECLELFHYSYKMYKKPEISRQDFEEFYRIMSFLISEEDLFEKIIKTEWKNVLNLNNEVNKPRPQKVIKEVKKQDERVENFDLSHHSYKDKEDFPLNKKNIKLDQLNLGQVQRKPYNEETDSQWRDMQTRTPKQERPTTPLSRKLDNKPTTEGTLQNQYQRPSTPIRSQHQSDLFEILKEKMRKRGLRGLMNLHKQFLLNCTNLQTISFGDFVKVLKLQRYEIAKEVYSSLFDRCKMKNQNYLNFSEFIRHFKQVLPDQRLSIVEKAFASLDVDSTEMLFIDDVRLKFDGSRHPDVLRKTRSEDEILMEFLDCFELNYNFLVIKV
jgi:Ca2+-binding EF-hand superfamily protein